jgi:hypothetical protein
LAERTSSDIDAGEFTDGITLLNPNSRPVGLPQPLPSKDWIQRDFVWSMLLACPNADPRFQICVP